MQYRLSTLFLIFFVVAATLALCGALGIWIALVFLLAALMLHRSKHLIIGWSVAVLVVFIFATPAFIFPAMRKAQIAAIESCNCNVNQIGMSLLQYHNAHKHFPPLNITDGDGKPLHSWRVEILPYMEYDALYKQLNKEEHWDSPKNKNVYLRIPNIIQFIRHNYAPPDVGPDTCYMAVVGPGTAWRSDGAVKLSDLPDGGSHTVMLVEVANSGVHWAAPRDLTVGEALEGLKTGKGLRISTELTTKTVVLMADGTVHSLPTRIPLSLWKKLLAGELSHHEIVNLKSRIDPYALDMVEVSLTPNEPVALGMIYSLIVWLVSLILLFNRAIESRRIAMNA